MVISIRRSQHEEGEELVAIWCRSVDATHDFLSAEYRAELEELVGYADRVIIMRDRKQVAEIPLAELSVPAIMNAIAA